MTVGITELPPEGMQLGGVALAGDAERGTKTTDGLSLLFTTAGITVQARSRRSNDCWCGRASIRPVAARRSSFPMDAMRRSWS